MTRRGAATSVGVRTVGVALVMGLVGLGLIGTAGAAPGRVTLPGTIAGRRADLVRRVAPGATVQFQLYLGLRDPAGATDLLHKVSTPGSASYRHYLSPVQFRARYSWSSSAVAQATSWARTQGFAVGEIPADHTTVDLSGTAAQVDRAFGVNLGFYRTGHGVRRAADRAPSVPASVASVVRGVLDLTPQKMHHGTVVPPPAAYRDAQPCSFFWAGKMATDQPRAMGRILPYAPCGYTPQQMRDAYGLHHAIASGNDGTGVTVAVIDAFASPTMQKDLDIYSQHHNLPHTTIQQFKRPACPVCPPGMQNGWWEEEVMDLDAVHSMAPGANLVFWGAASPWDKALRHAMVDIVDNHRADVITDSWGDVREQQPGSDISAWHDVFIQAGLEGISITFSSGDDGNDSSIGGYTTTEIPVSDPLVTGVGGTSLAIGALHTHLFETGWGTLTAERTPHGWGRPTYWGGSGGGTSRIFPEPWYQKGVVPQRLASLHGGSDRVVPDISMDADPYTGFLTGETMTFPSGRVRYGEYDDGGTSLSSPLFAGFLADADQAAGTPLGFVNPLLYSMGGTYALRDIVAPPHTVAAIATLFNNWVNANDGRDFQLVVFNHDGGLHTRRGYDNVTGMGSPRGQAFLDALP